MSPQPVNPVTEVKPDERKRLKWLIYDVEWLLEQTNKITVKRNRDTIKAVLAYLKDNSAAAEGWQACNEKMPPECTRVSTKIHDDLGVRAEHILAWDGGHWYRGGRAIQGWVPTHWKHRA